MLPHSCDHITGIQLKLKGLREDVSLWRHCVELTIAILLSGHSYSPRCLDWCLEISAQGGESSVLLSSYSSVCTASFLILIYAVGEQTMPQNAILEFGFIY